MIDGVTKMVDAVMTTIDVVTTIIDCVTTMVEGVTTMIDGVTTMIKSTLLVLLFPRPGQARLKTTAHYDDDSRALLNVKDLCCKGLCKKSML